MLSYDYPLYRPPSEARSLIIQATLGCSYNECSFCDMYRSKEYSERPWEQVRAEIDMMAESEPDTRRVFIADGDALNLDAAYLEKIVCYLRSKFSKLERIACYAMPMNVLKKTPDELASLHDAGLDMLYLGIESGSDVVLRHVTKGAVAATIVRACKKAKAARFTLSCMVILGLGGKKYTTEHAAGTAEVLSAASPHYVGVLTLYLENGIKSEFLSKYKGTFEALSDEEALDELDRLVGGLDVQSDVVFRATHGSNAYMFGGTLPHEKDAIMQKISWARKHPETSRPKGLRGF